MRIVTIEENRLMGIMKGCSFDNSHYVFFTKNINRILENFLVILKAVIIMIVNVL
mgnify:CR=1 FL=1